MFKRAPKMNREEGTISLFAERLSSLGIPRVLHQTVRLVLWAAAASVVVVVGYEMIEVLSVR